MMRMKRGWREGEGEEREWECESEYLCYAMYAVCEGRLYCYSLLLRVLLSHRRRAAKWQDCQSHVLNLLSLADFSSVVATCVAFSATVRPGLQTYFFVFLFPD